MNAVLDWSQCHAVENVAGRVSGAWVLRDTRMPVSVIFENLEYGASIEEIIEHYRVTREQVQAVLEFAAWSAAAPTTGSTRQIRCWWMRVLSGKLRSLRLGHWCNKHIAAV